MPIKVRVGQTDAVKILSSAGGGSVESFISKNVIGGIASVTQLDVTGISTFNGNINVTGVSTFNDVIKFNNADVIFQGAAAGQNITFDASENDLEFTDLARLKFGEQDDLEIWHGTNNDSHIKNSTNDLKIRSDSLILKREDDSEPYLKATVNEDVKIYYNGNEKFATTNEGVLVSGLTTTGTLSVTGVSTFNGDAFFNGIVTATTFSGIITTAAQPNITSVGTLSSLNISGIASITDTLKVGTAITASGGIITATTFSGNATTATLSVFSFMKNNSTTDETVFPVFVDGDGNQVAQELEIDSGFMYNPSTGILSATTFKGSLTGDVTGNVSGNTGTATSLANARTIGGVSFDGTANIDLPGVNTSGNQNTTGTAGGLSGTPSITVQDITAETVSIGGTLSYEDVTNVDSVGLVTAREGVRISTGGLVVTSGVSTFSGIATFTQNVFVEGTLTAELIDGGVF